MPTAKPLYFMHRRYFGDNADSVCNECFRTVASAKDERELIAAEQAHVCLGLASSSSITAPFSTL